MKNKSIIIILSLLLLFLLIACQQQKKVEIRQSTDGFRLEVEGEHFMIKGMNWDYFPIGTNYSYSLWDQPEDVIKEALHSEMSLLQKMGVNAIRQYTGVPAKWITYIYEKYGIYTMLNHPFGRYGISINDVWIEQTQYVNSKVKVALLAEVKEMAEAYKDTPGLLLFLLGNENNYGLFWEGVETEDIPKDTNKATEQAIHLYKLFNEATLVMKSVSDSRPIAICNGDLQFIDIIAEECPNIDILGVNIYRGISFGDAFQVTKKKLNKPILITEFGADAFNAIKDIEDEDMQARYVVANWKEICDNTAGEGKAENCIGGFVFQFSDGWWKHSQDSNLSVHDTEASWANGGYKEDYKKGQNNMNEEWFGVCAKGKPNEKGIYKLYPRKAYQALKNVFSSTSCGNKNLN